jgi:hypothetical protein
MPATISTPRIRIDPKRPRPIRLDWFEKASALPGKVLHVSLAIWLMASIGQAPTIRLTRATMARVNVSRFAAGDALNRLADAGLVKVWRLPGRSPMVTLTEPGSAGTPLKFPIQT